MQGRLHVPDQAPQSTAGKVQLDQHAPVQASVVTKRSQCHQRLCGFHAGRIKLPYYVKEWVHNVHTVLYKYRQMPCCAADDNME